MNVWWKGLLALSCMLFAKASAAQADSQLQAGLAYRFVQFTEWNSPTAKTYCVAGDRGVFEALKQLVKLPDQVRAINNKREAKNCNILFLGREQNSINQWQSILDDPNILSIAASAELFNQGAIFGLIIEPKQIAFRVNLSLARTRDYRLNSRMLKLAKEIH